MAFRHVGVAVILGWCVSAASADAPAPRPGERVWQLNSYLKGTSSQIKDSLSAEVRRFKGLITETTAAIEDEKKTIESHKQSVLAQSHTAPEYLKAQEESKAHEAKLNQARAAKDSRGAMEYGRQFNNARSVMTRIERDAEKSAMASTVVKGATKRLADAEAKLPGLKQGLADAIKWRDEVGGATRNSFLLTWPLETGKIGTLGEVIPKSVDADGNFVCSYKAAEKIRTQGETKEGLTTIRVLLHPTTVVIQGATIDVKSVTFDKPMRFDQSMSIVSVTPESKPDSEALVVVQIRKDDLGELLAAINAAMAE